MDFSLITNNPNIAGAVTVGLGCAVEAASERFLEDGSTAQKVASFFANFAQRASTYAAWTMLANATVAATSYFNPVVWGGTAVTVLSGVAASLSDNEYVQGVDKVINYAAKAANVVAFAVLLSSVSTMAGIAAGISLAALSVVALRDNSSGCQAAAAAVVAPPASTSVAGSATGSATGSAAGSAAGVV